MTPAANRPRRGSLPTAMRALLALGFLLAIGATVLVVFSEEVRWLRFAVVLGLWSALAAGFAMVWFRRDARTADLRAEDSKRTYELELHREISARREYEIGVVEAAREDAETRHREELAGLREQLDRLNTTLSGLLEGDLLFERLTLSAESTRVRQVGDNGRNRLAAMGHPGQLEGAPEPTGPYIGRQSAAPSQVVQQAAVGQQPVPYGFGGPYPVREDDTIQFPRAAFGIGVEPVADAPLDKAVVEAEPEPAVPAPEAVGGAEPEAVGDVEPEEVPYLEPEAVGDVEPEVVGYAEPEAVPYLEPEAVGDVEPEVVGYAEPEPVTYAEPAFAPPTAHFVEPETQPQPGAVVEPEAEAPVEPEPALAQEPAGFVEPASEVAAEEAEPEPAMVGAGHSAGISVADLLAAYGSSGEGAPHRRRRAED